MGTIFSWILPMAWMVLVFNLMTVHGCLDMLIKEFTQMFAGPGGTLIGGSNTKNLDRIRIFNNYQAPSIDEIQDEQNLEGKFDESDADDDYNDTFYEDPDEYETEWKKNRIEQGKTKMKLMSTKEENFKQEKQSKVKNKQKYKEKPVNRIRNSKNKCQANKDNGINKKIPFKRENIEEDKGKMDENRKIKCKRLKAKNENVFRSTNSNFKGLFQREPMENGLYNLEPKTSDYNSKYYKRNYVNDDDGDDRTFQTRDDRSNVIRTKKIDQPLINMMINMLDTIQLTSKHDYKRAKEKELRDHARWKVQNT